MPALTRQQKITFGEMRESGVDRILIYCADYKCSHSKAITPIDGRMTFGCPISSRGSGVRHATIGAPTSALISAGYRSDPLED
jgi:hypothetical protein